MPTLLQSNPALAVLIGGLIIGFVFGALLQRTQFCVMGAISDMVLFGDQRRLRAWLLAATVAIIATQLLDSAGFIDTGRSRYLGTQINWFTHIAGGLVFGFGMVLAGGCASRNLARAGGGDLRAFVVVLVVASTAFATITGVIGYMRVELAEATGLDIATLGARSQHIGDLVAAASSADRGTIRTTVSVVLLLALIAFVVKDKSFLTSPRHVISGLGVGMLVTAAWLLTSLAYDDFADRPVSVEALSFVSPLGKALDWLQRATAIGLPGFAAASVFGTLLGAIVAALVSGTFRWQTFADVPDTFRHLAGAALMGIGGVLALGCTIGQGVSGISTLSLGSLLSLLAIAAGAVAAVNVMMR